MDPYNPAKYVLRAPPPIPPRPGATPVPSPRNDGLVPSLPPRPPRPPAAPQPQPQAFPPPPRRHGQQGTQAPVYSGTYNPGQYTPPPPPVQAPYHYTAGSAPAPGQYASQTQQQSVSPSSSAYQSPPYYAPPPSTGHVPSSPQAAGYGSSPSAPQHATHGNPGTSPLPSYHLSAAPAYPPPPAATNYVPPAVQGIPAQQAAVHAQPARPGQTPSYQTPPAVSSPGVSTYPPPPPQSPTYAQGNNYAQPAPQENATQQGTVQFPAMQPPSYNPSPVVSTTTSAVPTYPLPPAQQDTDYYGPPVSSGEYQHNQANPSRARVSAHNSPTATASASASTGSYHAPYMNNSQDTRKPPGTAERHGAGDAVVSPPPQATPPYHIQPEEFVNYSPPSYEQPQAPPPGPPPASGSRSGVEGLTESLSHTHINQTPEQPRQQNTQPRSKAPPRPPIQYDPPTRFTLRQCPSIEYTFTGEGQWYIHPQVPDFRICVFCYEKHIQSTRFEREFPAWTSPAGSSPQCLFSCPRIEDDIWPRALHSGDLQELLQFFAHRLTVPICPRQRGVPATEIRKWYQPRDKQRFPDFLSCQACYEDILLSGPLRAEFTLFTGTQAKETLFICDATNLFVRKLATKTNSMETFIPGIIRHLRLPECEKGGALSDGPSRKWYQLRNPGASSISICERCFGEYAVYTDFETHFQPIPRPNSQHRCMLGLWQARSVWDEALANHDFTLWERTMLEINSVPLCTLEIARGVPVYQIPGVENFDICHSCYVSFLKPFGMDRFFQRVRDPVYGQCACDLNAGSPRITAFAKKLDEAMVTATFSTFAMFAARLGPTDLCPKLDLVSGRSWFGNESCRICPACYEEVVRDTYLAATCFPPTPIILSEEVCCDLFSPRMRDRFKTACATQDAHSFLAFATHRRNIYTQTVPEMRALVARAKHSLSMQKMYNTTSSAYNNMDGISSVGMYDSGIRYTGAGVGGVFRTHWGVEGAAMGQSAMGYLQQVQVDSARVRYLQGVWDGVE